MLMNRKVVIIGDGAVGSTLAYTLLLQDSVNDIVIVDLNKKKAEGDVLDMIHGMSFLNPKKIKAGDYSDIKDAHIIVITAGVAQKEGESRIDLLNRNLKVFDSIIASMKPYLSDSAIVMVVTNPVDILSYYVYKKLGIPSNRVIGSGTVLDTSRLKSFISEDAGIDPRNVHTFVVGEHGDSEVALFSSTSIAGLPLKEFCSNCNRCKCKGLSKFNLLLNQVKNAAYEIIDKKGATYYAVALAVAKIIASIVDDTHSILTVSTYVKRYFDGKIEDVYLSLPSEVGSNGVIRIINTPFDEEEKEALIKSSTTLKEKIRLIDGL